MGRLCSQTSLLTVILPNSTNKDKLHPLIEQCRGSFKDYPVEYVQNNQLK